MKERNPASLAEKAYREIKSKIVNLSFPPGSMLVESELAKSLKMSRTPIRVAIQRLNHEGFATTKPRVGTFVKSFSWEEIKQMQEIAEALESMAIKIATEKASERDIKRVEKIINSMENALAQDDVTAWMRADVSFHSQILEIADNKFMRESIQSIIDKMHQVRLITMRAHELRVRSTREHRKMMEAIKARKAELARKITQAHWTRVREDTANYLSNVSEVTVKL